MTSKFARHAAIAVTVFLAATGCNSERPRRDDFDERGVLTYLASDELEGRGLGSAGLDRAATFIADQFRANGVRPVSGLGGYFQNFETVTATEPGPKSSLRVGDQTYELGKQFVPMNFSPDRSFDGEVVFVGYGMKSTEHNYDDYAGVDVKDKIVLAMRFEPHDGKGKSRFAKDGWSADAAFVAKARAARDAGAAAMLIVTPPEFHEDDEKLSGAGGGSSEILPVMRIRQSVADDILRRAGAADLKTLQHKIDQGGKPASAALTNVKVNGATEILRTRVPAKNVVGFVPGVKRDEYVVVGAHYDHLGRGMRGHGRIASTRRTDNDIYNGADDNASGATAMLKLASRVARGPTPRRSIIFVAFTGEEEGLLGSAKFVEQPPVPLSQVVAMLNLDMVGRIRATPSGMNASSKSSTTTSATTREVGEGILYVGGSGTAPSFAGIVRRVDERSPLSVLDIGRGGLGPSDHMSFALKKIPVMFFFSGLHGDYHRPTDDEDKINYRGIDLVVDLVQDTLNQVAALPREAYVSSADASSVRMGSSSSGSRVTLGVVPDYGSVESGGGARISGTTPGTPAAAAGLKAGDSIVKFGERDVETLYDLTDCLAAAKPGQKVKLKILRDKQPIEVEVTLAERK